VIPALMALLREFTQIKPLFANCTMSRLALYAFIFSLISLSGYSRESDEAFRRLQQSVQQRTGKTVTWEEDQAARETNLIAVRRLLRQPLTIDTAVQAALLNNRSLQATFAEISLSAADLMQAATIPNPQLDLAVRIPDKPPSGTYQDYGAAIDFLSIIMIPLKKRVAKDDLEAATLRVASDTLELVARVKSAFYSLQASVQLSQRIKLIAEANAASADLAQRQHDAGNISDFALDQQEASYSRSRLDIITVEAEIRQDRDRLNRLLGIWGPDTHWEITDQLPEIPSSEPALPTLERLAIAQRLDLQANYLSVSSLAKNLGLTKAFRLLGALEFGPEIERETDGQTRTGPTFAIELPIFNQGQARIAKGEAALKRAEDTLEALAVDIHSQIRELYDRLIAKREVARSYQNDLVPIQRRILSEGVRNYNAMQINDFELFAIKAEEERTEREYLIAIRDYWITRTELEEAVGGNLNPRLIEKVRSEK
jgi:outer membrane protein, heavy metal efflux system